MSVIHLVILLQHSLFCKTKSINKILILPCAHAYLCDFTGSWGFLSINEINWEKKSMDLVILKKFQLVELLIS